MCGVLGSWSSQYLVVLSVLMIAFFGLPMALWPLRWAAVLRWRMPEHTHLAIYFGRCLGSVVVVLGVASLHVARTPALQPFWFGLLVANGAVMVLVHAYGAIRRIQPATETWEIAFWAGLVLLTLAFWPVA